MAKQDFTPYQQKIIQRFYDGRDGIDEEKLSELVASLYLAEGKKRDKLWKQAEEIMIRLKVPEYRMAHIMKSADPTILASIVQDIQAGKKL